MEIESHDLFVISGEHRPDLERQFEQIEAVFRAEGITIKDVGICQYSDYIRWQIRKGIYRGVLEVSHKDGTWAMGAKCNNDEYNLRELLQKHKVDLTGWVLANV